MSYISEVPIWKSTYRIVLDSKKEAEPLLQGWAIVDNTIGEDWNNVELSLVAGAPQSFIEQLSQPYYSRRPVVALPENVQITPQTHESSMTGTRAVLSGTVFDPAGAVVPGANVQVYSHTGEVAATTQTDVAGNYQIFDLPPASYRLEFKAAGFRALAQGVNLGGSELKQDATLQLGAASETVEVTASSATVNTDAVTVAALSDSESGARTGSGRGLGSGRGVGGGVRAGAAGGQGNGMLGGVMEGVGEARQTMIAAAQGAELGDFFEYKLKDPVTIHKNESALVPILQTRITAEKVSLWNASSNSQRPLRALWLTNSSPLTIDGGSFSVLEDEAFAGEGLTESVKPGDKRLLSYAEDLGMRVTSTSKGTPDLITRVVFSRGVMLQTNELRSETSYTIRNDDTTPRTLIVEHPLRPGWHLAEETQKPEEATSAVYRFREVVAPKGTSSFTVAESNPQETSYLLTNLTDNQIAVFVQRKTIDPQVQEALQKISEKKRALASIEDDLSKREDESSAIYDDQQRLRENLKALKGSPEERALTQRYTQQLADQETRLAAIKKETTELEAKRDAAQADLNNFIENLTLKGQL